MESGTVTTFYDVSLETVDGPPPYEANFKILMYLKLKQVCFWLTSVYKVLNKVDRTSWRIILSVVFNLIIIGTATAIFLSPIHVTDFCSVQYNSSSTSNCPRVLPDEDQAIEDCKTRLDVLVIACIVFVFGNLPGLCCSVVPQTNKIKKISLVLSLMELAFSVTIYILSWFAFRALFYNEFSNKNRKLIFNYKNNWTLVTSLFIVLFLTALYATIILGQIVAKACVRARVNFLFYDENNQERITSRFTEDREVPVRRVNPNMFVDSYYHDPPPRYSSLSEPQIFTVLPQNARPPHVVSTTDQEKLPECNAYSFSQI